MHAAEHLASGADPWDTVKPLAPYFTHMHRVLLFDGEPTHTCGGDRAR